jgi:dCMP deaminase
MRDKISWDEYAMGLISPIAIRSEDPHTKVGAVILDKDGRIVGTGYNSLPRGLSQKDFPLTRPEKYSHIVHAELNAILFSDSSRLEGSTLYVSFLPCCECAKCIVQVGISKVIYGTEYISKDSKSNQDIGTKMMQKAGIKVEQYSK